MPKQEPFSLVYDPQVRAHLDAIEPKYHSQIRTGIEEQLQSEPETITRNRKPLKRPIDIGARWKLRLGPSNRFRIFYRVEPEAREVHILAVAVKERNRIFIGGEEVKL